MDVKAMTKKKLIEGNKEFNKNIDRVKKTAKEWGYKSKREQIIFLNGWFLGFADSFERTRGKP